MYSADSLVYIIFPLSVLLITLTVVLTSYIKKNRELASCLTLQEKVSEILAASARTENLYGPLLRAILEHTTWTVAGALEVDEARQVLQYVDLQHQGNEAASRYCAATYQIIFARGSGIVGHVWETRQALLLPKLNDQPLLARGAYLAKSGLSCGLFLPITDGVKLLGILELFGDDKTKLPSAGQLETLKNVTGQISTFIARTAAQRSVYQSEEELRAVIDTAPDGIIRVDDAGRIESINAAATRLLGYTAKEMQGENLMTFVPSSYKDKFGSSLNFFFRSVMQQLVGRMVEGTGQRKDGTTFPLELAVSSLLVDDKEKYTGIIRDISDRKHMEKRVSEFYSTVSHELRSPLASIRGSLGLIEGGAIGPVPLEVLELVQIAKRNCDRLIRLINDILDAKKMEAGKLELARELLDSGELLFLAVEGMVSIAAESDVTIVTHRAEHSKVLGDADRIVQVLTNLLSNAIKYSPVGGQVDVYVAPAINGNHFVRFCVQDRGPGIHSDQLAKLFSEFHQLDSSDSRRKGGTGLGLAISKSIVEQMNGQIGVDNLAGTGATFWFELPSAVRNSEPSRSTR